jgi:hypothetical protein
MKAIAAAILLLPASLSAQFEGMIESKNTSIDELGKEQRFTMTIWVKGTMAKITNSATGSSPAVTMIYRSDLQVLWVIDDQEKTYYEMRQGEGFGDAGQTVPTEKAPGLKKTGKTKKILGYACAQYLVNNSGAVTEIWGTRSLPGLAGALARAVGQDPGGAETGWADELTRLDVYPLEALTRIDGKIVESHSVTAVQRRAVEGDIFALPAGYVKQSVNDMLK